MKSVNYLLYLVLKNHLIMPVDHDRRSGEDGAVGERPDLDEAALVGEDPVELGDALLVDAVLQVLGGI